MAKYLNLFYCEVIAVQLIKAPFCIPLTVYCTSLFVTCSGISTVPDVLLFIDVVYPVSPFFLPYTLHVLSPVIMKVISTVLFVLRPNAFALARVASIAIANARRKNLRFFMLFEMLVTQSCCLLIYR